MSELLPCPFCGGEARLHDNIIGFSIFCANDDCDIIAATGTMETKEVAIEAWNTRAERTCHLIEDGDLLHCSNCGGAAAKQSWAYWNFCPNCGAKVVGE